jgi:hypothetical protein
MTNETQFPSDWRETAKHFKPTEIVEVNSYDEVASALLQGYQVRTADDERAELAEAFSPRQWDEKVKSIQSGLERQPGRQGHTVCRVGPAVPYVKLFAFLACLLFASPAFAELRAVVSGPNKLKADTEYTLSAKRSTDAIKFEWSVLELPEYDLGAFTWDDDRLVSVMFDTPGTYTIRLKVIGKPDAFTGEKMLPSGAYNPEYVLWLEPRAYKQIDVVTESIVDHKVVVGDPPPNPPPGPTDPSPNKIDRVTFVFEKSKHPIPPQVAAAISKLNKDHGILASLFEQDSVDGKGQIPDQYKLAREAALKNGLPCLVAESGGKVVKIKSAPQTEADVMEVVK